MYKSFIVYRNLSPYLPTYLFFFFFLETTLSLEHRDVSMWMIKFVYIIFYGNDVQILFIYSQGYHCTML